MTQEIFLPATAKPQEIIITSTTSVFNLSEQLRNDRADDTLKAIIAIEESTHRHPHRPSRSEREEASLARVVVDTSERYPPFRDVRRNCRMVLSDRQVPTHSGLSLKHHGVTSILPEGVAIGNTAPTLSAPGIEEAPCVVDSLPRQTLRENTWSARRYSYSGRRLSARSHASQSPPGTPAEPDIAARARIS
jgi:hypothetical protein